jgi:hypothetical protein
LIKDKWEEKMCRKKYDERNYEEDVRVVRQQEVFVLHYLTANG